MNKSIRRQVFEQDRWVARSVCVCGGSDIQLVLLYGVMFHDALRVHRTGAESVGEMRRGGDVRKLPSIGRSLACAGVMCFCNNDGRPCVHPAAYE